MGLFDFLFGKKDNSSVPQSKSEYSSQSATSHSVSSSSQTPLSRPVAQRPTPQPAQHKAYSTGSNNIVDLALQLNMAHNTGSSSANYLCGVLYNEVGPRKQGGHAIINLSSEDCQCVGLAFTAMALCYNFGDEDINSVAVEDAFFCLSRNLIDEGNTFVAPAIFTLMQKGGKLMKDQLISSWCSMAQKQVGMPIGIMLGGNPFKDPRLEEFRQQAIGFRNDIAYYALLKFYDVDKQEYTIPTDMPYFIPSESEVNSLLAKVKENPSFGTDSYIKNCEEHFISVYEECKDTLNKY